MSTVAGKLNVLAGFYKYAVIDGVIAVDPMLHVQRPQIERISTTLGLTRTEFADVLKVAEDLPPREHAIMCLLGLNGMRVSEVVGIDIEDLGRHKGQRTVKITRKGGKSQVIPLAPRTSWQVEQTCGDRTAGPMFLSLYGGRIDRRAIGRIVARACRKAGIQKRITPHSLRHTFVTMALDAGMAERDIAASTGHADTRMVSYYDRGRDSISRNVTHSVAAWVEGAA
jgi:integrase